MGLSYRPLGLLAMGFFAGGFDFDTIRSNASNIPAQRLPLIVFALVIGLGVKLAAFLLHIWLPYAHSEAPTPISALLSPAMIGIGAYGLLRLWMELACRYRDLRAIQFVHRHVGSCYYDLRRCNGPNAGRH